jgi:hypothetical protein
LNGSSADEGGLISGLANRVSGGNLPDGSVNISG